MKRMTSRSEDLDCWSDVDEDALAQVGSAPLALDKKGHLITTSYQSPIQETLLNSGYTLECDKILEGHGVPLNRYLRKYLTVTDLASQHWCEQKLLYDFSPEVYILRAEPGVEVKIQEDVEAKIAKGKGADIHMARELEIQVPVEVPVQTIEDRWAVKFHNLHVAVTNFLNGHCQIAREVPIFGCPFDGHIFVYGIVDEIRYDPDNHSLQISELKTRRSLHLPKRSHQEKDKFQLGIYRQLFNELVLGKVAVNEIQSHLCLELDRPLSKGTAEALCQSSLKEEQVSVRSILVPLLDQIQSLTCIEMGHVEYIHQETKTQIAKVDLDKEAEEIGVQFRTCLQWWNGDRGTQGVDVEDCWKCEFCEFSQLCEWRDYMAQKMSKKSVGAKRNGS